MNISIKGTKIVTENGLDEIDMVMPVINTESNSLELLTGDSHFVNADAIRKKANARSVQHAMQSMVTDPNSQIVNALTGTAKNPTYAFKGEGDGLCKTLVAKTAITRPMTDSDALAARSGFRIPRRELHQLYKDGQFNEPNLGASFAVPSQGDVTLTGTNTKLGMERRVYRIDPRRAAPFARGPHQKPAWTKQYLVDQGGAWDTIHELGSFDNVARRLEHVSPDVALGYMDEDGKHVLGQSLIFAKSTISGDICWKPRV